PFFGLKREKAPASNEPFFIVSYSFLLFFKTNLMVASISKWSGEQNCARGRHNGNHCSKSQMLPRHFSLHKCESWNAPNLESQFFIFFLGTFHASYIYILHHCFTK